MRRIDELRLIAQCVLGDDRQAFGRLVEAYQTQLRRFLLNLTRGDESLTDDLAQETFVKAYLNVRNFKGLSGFRTWLYRIAYNEYYSHMRRRREVMPLESAETQAADSGSPGSVEAAMTVRQAMAALPDDERVIVTLFYIEDLPVKKIATIVGMNENTVKSHLRRAKERLRQTINTPY